MYDLCALSFDTSAENAMPKVNRWCIKLNDNKKELKGFEGVGERKRE